MMKYKNQLLTVLVLLFISTACTSTYFARSSQTHLDYPNSNVVPLSSEKVKGLASEVQLFSGGNVPSKLKNDAINNALSKVNGADMLINVTYKTKISPFMLFTVVSLEVEGTPVKMEIGKQKLN